MSSLATEKAQVVILVVLVFLLGKFTFLTKLFREVRLLLLTLGLIHLGLLLLLTLPRSLGIHIRIGVGVAQVLTLMSVIIHGHSGRLVLFGLGYQDGMSLLSELTSEFPVTLVKFLNEVTKLFQGSGLVEVH
jgi:hypothetical protein